MCTRFSLTIDLCLGYSHSVHGLYCHESQMTALGFLRKHNRLLPWNSSSEILTYFGIKQKDGGVISSTNEVSK